MSKQFVSDPREIVKPGDIVRVKVLDVDATRKRISLTLRLDDEAGGSGQARGERRSAGQSGRPERGERQGRDSGRQGQGKKPSQGQGKKQGQGRQGGNRNGRDRAPDGAMADALRRAGFDKR